MSQKLPLMLKKYFWDVDFDKLSLDKHAFFIAERVLSFGNSKSLKWVIVNNSDSLLKEVVHKSRFLDPKTKNFWNYKLQNHEFTFRDLT